MMSETVAEPTAGLSQVERVVDAFVAPSKTFTDVLRSKNILLPLLLIAVCTYVFTLSVAQRVGYDKLAESAIHANPSAEARIQSLPADQAAKQMQYQQVGMKYTVYTFPVFFLIFLAIYALLLWPTLNFGLGGEATYGSIFVVMVYASMPRLILYLVSALMLWVSDPPEFFLFQDPIGTNPGFYLEQHSGWLYSLLTSFDLFQMWEMVLMSIGCAIVAKLSTKTAAMAVFGWWLLITVIKVGVSAAMG